MSSLTLHNTLTAKCIEQKLHVLNTHMLKIQTQKEIQVKLKLPKLTPPLTQSVYLHQSALLTSLLSALLIFQAKLSPSVSPGVSSPGVKLKLNMGKILK